jgi:eukaryotic-like serine/threonine-protein kinase
MRFMILVRATPLSESGAMPTEQTLSDQLAFHRAIDEAGVLIDAMGFHPTSDAWRVVQRTDGGREVIEGPFPDDHLIAGYTLIDVASREEAMDWSLRYAKTALESEDGEIEVRQLFDLDDFVQGPAIHGFRELDLVSRIATDVGRSRPDLSGAVAPDGTVTVLFTDIEGSTQLTEALGDAAWIGVLREHNAIVREQVAAHSGFEVKSQGDGFMLAFASPEDAVRCAIGIQRALEQAPPNEHRLRVRIGLHTGEPIREQDDFFGKAVILAARIAAEARGGEILVSPLVRAITERSGEFSFSDPTDVELKGLSGMHRLSAVRWREDPPALRTSRDAVG